MLAANCNENRSNSDSEEKKAKTGPQSTIKSIFSNDFVLLNYYQQIIKIENNKNIINFRSRPRWAEVNRIWALGR